MQHKLKNTQNPHSMPPSLTLGLWQGYISTLSLNGISVAKYMCALPNLRLNFNPCPNSVLKDKGNAPL